MTSSREESTHLFPEMSSSMDESVNLYRGMSSSMDQSANLFLGRSSFMDEYAHPFPGLSNSMDEYAHPFPSLSSSMDESTHPFPAMNSRLHVAAEIGNVYTLNRLFLAKLNILQEFTPLGNSALHIAVSRGNLRFIERLLREVNRDLVAGREFLRAKNSHGNSALHLAAFHGHHELVKKFLGLIEGDAESNAGEFLSCVNSEGNTAFHEAAKGGNYKVVEVLLDHDPDHRLASVSNAAGETALFVASQSGHTNIVERLLSLTASNSGMKRADGQTPLHSAVYYRHSDVVQKLLQHSPELAKQTDGCGRTALHMLVLSPPVLGFMGADWEPSYNIKIVRLLLKKDNGLCYIEDNEKQTPLHMAVERANYHLVRILLKYGRDSAEMVDKGGRKLLHLAVINAVRPAKTFNIVELYRFKYTFLSLMSRESLNHRDNRGQTALQIAVKNIEKDAALYTGIVKVLELNGALISPEISEDKRRMELSAAGSNAERLSVNAVLIATVSFAAAFTLPGGLDSQSGEKPKAVFINAILFKLFVICDSISFCTSIASAILIQRSGSGEQQDQLQVSYSVALLGSALISLLVAFGAAVHLVIAPSPWLAGIVWTMVSLVPLTLYVVRCHSKRHIFTPDRYTIWLVLGYPLAIIWGISFLISDIFYVFLLAGLCYNVVRWIKKLLQRRG